MTILIELDSYDVSMAFNKAMVKLQENLDDANLEQIQSFRILELVSTKYNWNMYKEYQCCFEFTFKVNL